MMFNEIDAKVNLLKNNSDKSINYDQACCILESVSKLGSRPGLDNIIRLCELMGDPQDKLRFVHVAGSNGKGSTSAMVSSILQAAGYKTGLYLSPYLNNYRDSFYINSIQISQSSFADIIYSVYSQAKRMAEEGEYATEFEILTASAFLWFYQNECDIVVLETGMGGLLDATNVVKTTSVSVLTAITLDHTSFLGDTIEKITEQKCGIIKQGGTTVCYPELKQEPLEIIRKTAKIKGNNFTIPDIAQLAIIRSDFKGTEFRYCGEKLHVTLPGRHQVMNAITAIETVNALKQHNGFIISESTIKSGINNAFLPARQQVLSRDPLILLDGAHNLQGIQSLADSINDLIQHKYIFVVMGMLKDKQYEQSIEIMAKLCDKFIAVQPDNPRALDSEVAAKVAKQYCENVTKYDEPCEGLKDAKASCPKDGAVVICGSLYVAGKILYNN